MKSLTPGCFPAIVIRNMPMLVTFENQMLLLDVQISSIRSKLPLGIARELLAIHRHNESYDFLFFG